MKVLWLVCLLVASVAAGVHHVGKEVIDMHSHSSYSDGSDSALEVVRKAKAAGLTTLAITDHDQITIPTEAAAEAKKLGIELQVGTEISCEWPYHYREGVGKVHMLGYFFDLHDHKLNQALDDVHTARLNRNQDILDILKSRFDLDISMVEVEAQISGDNASPGRPHIAKAILAKKYVSNITEAFTKYLADDKLQLPPWALDFGSAARLIDQAGGMAVLAHPSTLLLDILDLRKELDYFLNVQKVPLRGLECYSSRHTQEQADEYVELANEFGLYVTGGSDFHGVNKNNVPIGLFGGGDAAWRADGPGYFHSFWNLNIKEQLEKKFATGGERAILEVLSYVGLIAAMATLSYWVLGQISTIDMQTDPNLEKANFIQKALIRNSCLRCFWIGDATYRKMATMEDQEELESVLVSQNEEKDSDAETRPKDSSKVFALKKFLFFAIGLLVSYVLWGSLQERIMTRDYGEGEMFTESEFLVVMNRFSAVTTASIMLYIERRRGPSPNSAPFFKYTFMSMSNILSSWFQYEALKFISFPYQVLGKSSKIVVTMLMGKFVFGKSYSAKEYMTSILITIGLLIFKLADNSTDDSDEGTDLMFMLGAFLIVGYIFCDSFTSQWQGKVFSEHKISPYQMMQGINLCSTTIGTCMLVAKGQLFPCLAFCFEHPLFLQHAVLMSVCSAFGQIFIFNTISDFGPVLFATIMTCRQAISIGLSCVLFGHTITGSSFVGIILVFIALVLKIYNQMQKKKGKK